MIRDIHPEILREIIDLFGREKTKSNPQIGKDEPCADKTVKPLGRCDADPAEMSKRVSRRCPD
jgi:hypothetical protein